jgi:hypothetical protein
MPANHSFQRTLGQEHATLLAELRKLEEVVALSPVPDPRTLLDQLDAVTRRVAEHFAFEEEGGYMAQVLERAPHLHRVAADLLAEHRLMAQALEQLADGLRAARGQPDRHWQEHLREWVARMLHHEARENHLVQDACNRDVAAED